MNLSSPFIHRPVATTLLNLSVVLAGAVAFRCCRCRRCRRSTSRRSRSRPTCPAPAPRRWPRRVATPLERALGTHRRRHRDDVEQLAGLDAHQRAVRPRQGHQRRRARGAGGDQRRRVAAAERPAGHPDLPQGQPVARADHDPGADVGDARRRARCTTSPRRCCAQKVAQVTGVGQVTVGGGSLPAVRVELQPDALMQYGIAPRRRAARDRAAPTCCGPRARSRTATRSWQIHASDQLTQGEASTSRSSSPTATARRSGWPTSPRSPTASRTASTAASSTPSRRCC